VFDRVSIFGTPAIHGVIVMLPLLLVFLFTKGRGMGFGDVKFTFILGFILGLWNGLTALYIAFLSGGLFGGVLLLTRKKGMKSKVPFGPFLILGMYLMIFFDNDIMYWIMKAYGF